MNKVINPGKIEGHNVFINIKTEQKDKGICLSITGVIGPKRNGDAISCGQILDSLKEIDAYAEEWNAETCAKLFNIWNTWHLNDMNAACVHQNSPEWDPSRIVSFIGFQKTTKGEELISKAKKQALNADDYLTIELIEKYHGENINSEMIPLQIPALVSNDYLEPWHWHFIEKQERAGWVNVKDGGLLCKPCPICGYKYGSEWLFREVPADVLAWLAALPDTKITPAWV